MSWRICKVREVYDYGFRIYNSQIANFLSVDPLTKSYPWYTPYQFAGNKPIECVDLDGLEEVSNKEIKKVQFVELKNVSFEVIIRQSNSTLSNSLKKHGDLSDKFGINTQMGEAISGTNPDYYTATKPQPNYISQGYSISNGEIIGGRSSPDTWHFAMNKNGVITAGKGNPSIKSHIAIGGATPLYVNGLKYGDKNI